MQIGKRKANFCRSCGNEKTRTVRGGRYHYYCDCEAWKKTLALLDQARRKDDQRRLRFRRPPAAAPSPAELLAAV